MNVLTSKKTVWIAYGIISVIMLAGSVAVSPSLQPVYRNWHILEMLIDYSNGFVRRGLLGFFLREVSFLTNEPLITILMVLGIVYSALSILWLNIIRSKSDLLKSSELFLLLFNPTLVLGFVFDGTLAGKDVIMTLFTLAAVALSHRISNRKGSLSTLFICLIIGISGILTALIHEGFSLFICLPILTLVLLSKTLSYRLTALVMLPSIGVIIASMLFHGDSSHSVAICEAWNDLLQFDCSEATQNLGAISAMGWSFSFLVLNYSGLTMLDTGQIFWWLVPFLFWTSINLIIVNKLVCHYNKDLNKLSIYFFTLLLIASLPFYVIADGWGRYYLVQSSLWVGCLCILSNSQSLTDLDRVVNGIYEKMMILNWIRHNFIEPIHVFLEYQKIRAWMIAVSVIIGLPVCCITMLGLLAKGALGASINRLAQVILYF